MQLFRRIRRSLVKLGWPLIRDVAVQEATAQIWQSTKPCYKCNVLIAGDARFCDKCGVPQMVTEPVMMPFDTNELIKIRYDELRKDGKREALAYWQAAQETENIKRLTRKL